MSELDIRTQLLAANLSGAVYSLLSTDSVWTAGLAEHDEDERYALVAVGRTMAAALGDVSGMASQLAERLAGHRLEELFVANSENQQWPESVPPDWAAELADLFQECVDALAEDGPDEQRRLLDKANVIESGSWTEGDLASPLDCALLGVCSVASLACIPLSAGVCGPIAAGFVGTFFGSSCASTLRGRLRRFRQA